MYQPVKTIRPVYYQDPGHGWVAVKREWLHALKIEDRITPYSYQRGQTVYLEEDCDMAQFHVAATAAGWAVTYSPRNSTWRSPIRSYDRYMPSI